MKDRRKMKHGLLLKKQYPVLMLIHLNWKVTSLLMLTAFAMLKKHLEEGDIKEGIITRIKAFGAFVEVMPGVEALLPQSALSEFQNAKGVIYKVGDKVDTKIIKFNPKDKRISLGLPTDDV
jgi:ribosomal protein S1